MKDKVVVDSHVRDLRHQIEKLTERLNDVSATNEKIATELLIVKNVNSNLEKSITALEKLQAKAEQYNRKNNVEEYHVFRRRFGQWLWRKSYQDM